MKKVCFSDVERLLQDAASLLAIVSFIYKVALTVARWCNF